MSITQVSEILLGSTYAMRPNILLFNTNNISSIHSSSSSSNSRRASSGSNGSIICMSNLNSFNNDDTLSKDNSAATLRWKLIKYFKRRPSFYATLGTNHNNIVRIDEGFQQQYSEQQKQQRRRSTPVGRVYASGLIESLNREDEYSSKRSDIIQRLPIELFCLILSYCDKPTIAQATRVSWYWYSLCTDNYLWHQLYLNHFGAIYNGCFPDSSSISTAPGKTATLDYQKLYKTKMELLRRWNSNTTTLFEDFPAIPSTSPQYPSYYEQQQQYNNDYRIKSVVAHKDSIYCVQFDGRKIVTGSRDKTVKFWHYQNPSHCYKTLYGHDASVLCLQYNDNVLITGSSDHTVIVWSMRTYQILYRLSGHSSGVLDVCFEEREENSSQNAKTNDKMHAPLTIASCSKDTTIKIWKDNRLVQSLQGHRGPVNAIQFKGNRLVSASGDTMIKLWDITTGKCLRDFAGHTHGLACVQFDGKTIVSGGNDNNIKIWNADTGECIFTCTGHVGLVRSLFFDEEKIVSGSYDQSIRIWNIKTGECIRTFSKCHTSWVFDVMFDETKIISTSQDQKIVTIDFAHDLDTTHIVKV